MNIEELKRMNRESALRRIIEYNISTIESKPHSIYQGGKYIGKFEIDRKVGTKDTYIITGLGHPKPKFKVGNKTFIVS